MGTYSEEDRRAEEGLSTAKEGRSKAAEPKSASVEPWNGQAAE